ncbi:MAG: hypothetical protein V3W34_02035 [Phycisphaerae bacterium]
MIASVVWQTHGFESVGFAAAAQQEAQPGRRAMDAVAAEVSGNVKRAAAGVDAKDKDGWTQVQLNDNLPAGTQIKTAFRSFVTLRFGNDTVVRVRAMTLASIDEFTQTQTEQSVRLSLGYGAIRGGTVERELRSELVVDSTVATLAKRGTQGLVFEVVPEVGYFEASLTRSGLLSLLHKALNVEKDVAAGESINQDTMTDLASDLQLKDLKFKFFSDTMETSSESGFSSKNTTGSSATQPGSGTESTNNTKQNDPSFVSQIIEGTLPPEEEVEPFPTFAERAEGDFGVPDTIGAILGDILPFRRVQEVRRDISQHARRAGRAPGRRARRASTSVGKR